MPENQILTLCEEDSEPIPDWLTKSYIEKALQTYKNDRGVKVSEIEINPATNKGESYASVMFRVKVKFCCEPSKCENLGSIIVKTGFENDPFLKSTFDEYDIYNREMKLYERIFPKMNALLQEIGDYEDLFPEMIFVDYDHTVIIFVDLTLRGFVMPDRRNGLDLEHTKLVLRKLAKIHAASARLNEIEKDLFKNYNRGMFNRYTTVFSPYYINNLEMCGNLVKQWEGFETYGEKLLKLKSKVTEYGRRAFDAKPSDFNVLCHGDIWVNNIMCIYDDKKQLVEANLLDFQYSCWASPAVDLHYYFNTSMTEDLRLHDQDQLVQFYYYALTDTLRAIGFKGSIPSLKDFWVQFMDKSFYAVTSAFVVQPVMLNENSENADFHSILGNDERSWKFRKAVYSNQKVHKNLKRLLPIFDRRGLLDVDD